MERKEDNEKKNENNVLITVSKDCMKAYITLYEPSDGKQHTINSLREILKEQDVVFGIKNDILKMLIEEPVYNKGLCIAEGKKPVNGKDGYVKFHFERETSGKPVILDNGRVDFRNLDTIKNVKKNQILCTLEPVSPGEKGMTVKGSEIPYFEGKPARLPKGKNTKIVEDEGILISNIDGQVLYKDGWVNVVDSYNISKDIDNSTGNVVFTGNVTIGGNILSGFTVEAGGNIEVWGVVEGAVLKAGRDIILKRGISGHGKGLIISGGDIISKYIENSTVKAKGNINAEVIMHSNISCGGNVVQLSGKKGLLVGGTCKAGGDILARVIGSQIADTVTDIQVGLDPEIKENYRKIKEEISNVEASLLKMEQAILILGKATKAGSLSVEKKELLKKSIKTREYYKKRLHELKGEVSHLEKKIGESYKGKVHCIDSIYPGTRITIGASRLSVKDVLHHCTLAMDGIDIRSGVLEKHVRM